MIIDNDYQTLTVKTNDNKILVRNIDEYNIMKYQDYKGDRIIKQLDKDTEVIETFNNGIFNIRYKTIKTQIRDRIEVCKRLRFCIENNTIEPIKELLQENINKEIKQDWLKEVLKPFGDRIEFKGERIFIDNMFAVDENGQAYVNYKDDLRSLCIVASQTGKMNYLISHNLLGEVKINFRTMEIYLKVLFLLFPNTKDSVFMNQLPKEYKEKLKNV